MSRVFDYAVAAVAVAVTFAAASVFGLGGYLAAVALLAAVLAVAGGAAAGKGVR